MQETAQETLAYLLGSVWVSLILAFLAGIAAVKTVSHDRRFSLPLFAIIGVLGLFLGEFMLIWLALVDYIEPIAKLRIIFDFIAAYVGSFFVAAIVHFIKPT